MLRNNRSMDCCPGGPTCCDFDGRDKRRRTLHEAQHLLVLPEERGDEHVGHGVARRGRPGDEHLRYHAGREHLGRGRGADERFDLLAGLGDPGAQKQVLRLPHHRAFAAQQDVDPGRKARRHAEFGVGAVLAAAKGDAVVDNGDLAMVAPESTPPHRPAAAA